MVQNGNVVENNKKGVACAWHINIESIVKCLMKTPSLIANESGPTK